MLNTITHGDFIEKSTLIDDKSIHLTITSPPYNVDLGNNKYNKNAYDLYNDNLEHCSYIEWLKTIFSIVYDKTVSSGRCVINIGDGKNGSVPTHSDIIHFMTREIGWIPMTTIIWNKSQIGNRTAWGSFMSPSSPSFPLPYEYILVFCKESKKLDWKGETDLTKEEFIQNAFGIWNMTPETRAKQIGHPAPFPLELPKRCMKMLSYPGDTVLDPFAGSGTTCLAAKQLNRNYVGFDISEDYCQIAEKRLQ